jgi:SAM-dependent methyltransferase
MAIYRDQREAERHKHYASAEALQTLSSWYADEKEGAFIDFIFNNIAIPSDGLIVEIGGGAGIHGRILGRRFGERYLFTDFSPLLAENAKNFGLQSVQMDGLSMALGDGAAACAFLVGPSTIVRDADMRYRQFLECARIVRPGGTALFVTSRCEPFSGLHTLDDADAEFLAKNGFSISWRSWGVIPGRLWNSTNKNFFRVVENLVARANISFRSILIAYRN